MNHSFIELMFSSTTPVSPVVHPLAALLVFQLQWHLDGNCCRSNFTDIKKSKFIHLFYKLPADHKAMNISIKKFL